VEQLLGLVEVTCVDGDEAEPGEGMDHTWQLAADAVA